CLTSTILITGGAGFIGPHPLHFSLRPNSPPPLILDKTTPARRPPNNLRAMKDPPAPLFQADAAGRAGPERVFAEHRPRAVLNLAAETHVDRSIEGAAPFIETNIVGTFVLLEMAVSLTKGKLGEVPADFRFLHVSTDEVYGTLGADGLFRENTPYAPNSPYAASKAAADHLVRAYGQTHGLPVLITNCSNNYGPYQFPEKLIPLMILNAIEGRRLPIYGDGGQIRDWLHV